MTETSPVSFHTRYNDPLDKRIETVGQVLPHVDAMVVDPDDETRTPLPLDAPGNLIVSGYNVCKGYWNNESETAKAVWKDADGVEWFSTGDRKS